MILKIYTIHDVASGVYMQPFCQIGRGVAIRAFSDSVKDKNHMFARHPGDYTLFEIGEYDDQTARMETYEVYISLGLALDYVDASQSPGQAEMFNRVNGETDEIAELRNEE